MRTPSGFLAFRLTFLLPPALGLSVAPGRQQPCLHGCILTIGALGHVAIDGPSRERVFEQASRFLKANSKGKPGYSVAAHLLTPDPRDPGARSGDSWSIIIGAEVAFSPTAIGPEIMPAEQAITGAA